ncbi:hypothetical protein GW17_00048941 [Ensete ventricosum]|nr:hypothetical protein GW17_00048941 [Ensete ventricosum]
MGLAAPWYRRGGTSVESSIPCSHGGRVLIVKRAEEVENAKANSKFQEKVEGQRPRNFIRLVRCSGISPKFTRRFAEGIGKLAGNTPGDRRKKIGRLTARMPEAVGLAGVKPCLACWSLSVVIIES